MEQCNVVHTGRCWLQNFSSGLACYYCLDELTIHWSTDLIILVMQNDKRFLSTNILWYGTASPEYSHHNWLVKQAVSLNVLVCVFFSLDPFFFFVHALSQCFTEMCEDTILKMCSDGFVLLLERQPWIDAVADQNSWKLDAECPCCRDIVADIAECMIGFHCTIWKHSAKLKCWVVYIFLLFFLGIK